jgi:3-methyladenine DNA glycosylase AlkC
LNPEYSDRNPGEGVPKETPGKNSLHVIDDIVCDVFADADIAGLLIQGNYFDLSLLKQFDLAVDTLYGLSDEPEKRQALLDGLKGSYADRMRGYASGMVYLLYKDNPEKCCQELYATGTLPGTWAQESGQKYVKWLMRDYGVEAILKYTLAWAEDENEAGRRLLVEALRPLGVWTGHLKELREDPSVLEAIIAGLLNDTSRYVQLAVGNCLNDISKDHPDTLCAWVTQWRKQGIAASDEVKFVIDRGMRSLLKQSHAEALVLMGYAPMRSIRVHWEEKKLEHGKQIRIGRQLPTSLRIENVRKQESKVRAQLIVEGPGAGNKPRRFIYLIQHKVIPGNGELTLSRKILFKHKNSQPKLPGMYHITLIVNGTVIETRGYEYREEAEID